MKWIYDRRAGENCRLVPDRLLVRRLYFIDLTIGRVVCRQLTIVNFVYDRERLLRLGAPLTSCQVCQRGANRRRLSWTIAQGRARGTAGGAGRGDID